MFTGRSTWRRLRWVGPLTIVVSLISNLILRMIGIAIFHISPKFAPLGIGPVVFWSVVTGIGAVLVFALVGRFSQNPIPLFLIIAFVVYLVTFYPDYLVLFSNPPVFPGTNFYSVATLLSMHVVEAAITMCMLMMMGLERKSKDIDKDIDVA
jgi:hypothetical protein